jgi:hypothetical protein
MRSSPVPPKAHRGPEGVDLLALRRDAQEGLVERAPFMKRARASGVPSAAIAPLKQRDASPDGRA